MADLYHGADTELDALLMIGYCQAGHYIIRLVTSDFDIRIDTAQQMGLDGLFAKFLFQLWQDGDTWALRVAVGGSEDLLHHGLQPATLKQCQHLLYQGEVIDTAYGVARGQILMIALFELVERQHLYWLLGKIQFSFVHYIAFIVFKN